MGGKVRHTAAVLSGNKTVAAVSSVYGPATLCFAGDAGEAAREGICRQVLGPDAVFRRRTVWAVPLCHVQVYSMAAVEAVPDIGKPLVQQCQLPEKQGRMSGDRPCAFVSCN